MAFLKATYPVFGSSLLENYLKRGKKPEFKFYKDLKEGPSDVRLNFYRKDTGRKFTMHGGGLDAAELLKTLIKKVKEIKQIKLEEIGGSVEEPVVEYTILVEPGYEGTKKINYINKPERTSPALLFAVKGVKDYVEEVNSTRESGEAPKIEVKQTKTESSDLDLIMLEKFVKGLGYLKEEAKDPVEVNVTIKESDEKPEIGSCSGTIDTTKVVMLKNALKKRFKEAKVFYLEHSKRSVSYHVLLG